MIPHDLLKKQLMEIDKKYISKEKAEEIIKKTIMESIDGVLKWITDHTDIVDITTGNVIPDAQLTQKEDAPEIYPYLADKISVLKKEQQND